LPALQPSACSDSSEGDGLLGVSSGRCSKGLPWLMYRLSCSGRWSVSTCDRRLRPRHFLIFTAARCRRVGTRTVGVRGLSAPADGPPGWCRSKRSSESRRPLRRARSSGVCPSLFGWSITAPHINRVAAHSVAPAAAALCKGVQRHTGSEAWTSASASRSVSITLSFPGATAAWRTETPLDCTAFGFAPHRSSSST
jgi:hypothetical protein